VNLFGHRSHTGVEGGDPSEKNPHSASAINRHGERESPAARFDTGHADPGRIRDCRVARNSVTQSFTDRRSLCVNDTARIRFNNGGVTVSLNSLCVALATCALIACRPNVSVGTRTCSEDGSQDPPVNDDLDASPPLSVEWSTSFENQFCDYRLPGGYCYPNAPGSFEIVTSPTPPSGQHAAAFTVTSDDPTTYQARCVRQGTLPASAYYSAWYYIPTRPTRIGNWNLFHFNGGLDWDHIDGLFDVSLIIAKGGGGLQLAVYGPPNHAQVGSTTTAPTIPIGTWFRIRLYVERTTATTGIVRLYQDDRQILEASNVALGDWVVGQWYVGNLATGLVPATNTVYVDDISISAMP